MSLSFTVDSDYGRQHLRTRNAEGYLDPAPKGWNWSVFVSEGEASLMVFDTIRESLTQNPILEINLTPEMLEVLADLCRDSRRREADSGC